MEKDADKLRIYQELLANEVFGIDARLRSPHNQIGSSYDPKEPLKGEEMTPL